MENTSQSVQSEEARSNLGYIEIFDIFLTDGTHLRYCTSSQDEQLLDQQEPQ